ncbi:MAG: hypothetical protein PCFJNLEI_03941 [Verrucomicrobiae bacterium]|nr:hypothetical protein [Verrucomicrobiae bacterium]
MLPPPPMTRVVLFELPSPTTTPPVPLTNSCPPLVITKPFPPLLVLPIVNAPLTEVEVRFVNSAAPLIPFPSKISWLPEPPFSPTMMRLLPALFQILVTPTIPPPTILT